MSQPTRMTLLNEIKAAYSSDRWTEFFSDYGDLLRRWLVARQVPTADADDIQQETILIVMRELANFEHNGNPGAFRNWLRKILANRIREYHRKRASRREVQQLDLLADQLEDERTVVSVDFQREHDRFLLNQLLKQAEDQFSPERVKLFRQLVLDQVPIDVLTQRYSLSTGAIRVQQHRILRWLKEVGSGLLNVDS